MYGIVSLWFLLNELVRTTLNGNSNEGKIVEKDNYQPNNVEIVSNNKNSSESNKRRMKPIDLLSLGAGEVKDFLNSFDTIISDCDGVLWLGEPISGVKETLQKLKEAGKRIHFVSNNCVKTPEQYQKQFEGVGISLEQVGLMHPGLAIIKYLKDLQFKKKVYCITTTMMMGLLTEAGFSCVTSENSSREDLKWFMNETKDDEDIGAVVVDFDVNVNYLKLRKALSILKRPDVLYIVGATERLIPVTAEYFSIGPGPFIDIITDLSGRKPIKLSKPSEHLKKIVLDSYNIKDPKRTLIIGDTFDHDMEFGQLCGFQKLLVLSGASSLTDVNNNNILERSPDFYIESLGKLLDIITKAD